MYSDSPHTLIVLGNNKQEGPGERNTSEQPDDGDFEKSVERSVSIETCCFAVHTSCRITEFVRKHMTEESKD